MPSHIQNIPVYAVPLPVPPPNQVPSHDHLVVTRFMNPPGYGMPQRAQNPPGYGMPQRAQNPPGYGTVRSAGYHSSA